MTDQIVVEARAASSMNSQPTRLPPAPSQGMWGSELAWIVVGIPAVTVMMWVAGGGFATTTGSLAGALTGVGQLAGLASGLAALGGLALAARPGVAERRWGLDRMLGWHRWTGMVAVFALVVHVGALVAAYSIRTGMNPWQELVFLFGEAWMPAAYAAAALMLAVAFTSWRRIKARMTYETWYYLHVLGYLAVALALGHVLVLGSDFTDNWAARAWWLGLYAAVAWLILWSRLRPLLFSLLRPLRVSSIEQLPDGALSVWLTGRSLRRARASAGQFYSLRFAVRGLWWQSHPYSLSAEPYREGLRFTFHVGDDATAFERIRRGSWVWVEGPYGRFTSERAQARKVVLVAGGSGIAPLRAMLADFSPEQRPEVILRVSDRRSAWFVDELDALVGAKGGRLHVVSGPRWSLAADPFAPTTLSGLVPDLNQRAAFVCGPTGMTRAASRGLRQAGVTDIYSERYGY